MNQVNQVNLADLADSPLFKGLAKKEIEYLGTIFSARQVSEGKTVFIENMPGESLYLIKRGTVRISQMLAEGDEQILIVLGVGDVFGELAVIDGGVRATSARIAEDAILYGLSRKDFDKLASTNPRLGMQLMMNVVRMFTARMRAAKNNYQAMLKTLLNRKD